MYGSKIITQLQTLPDLVLKILQFFSLFIILQRIDTQRKEYVELHVLTPYLTTPSKKNEVFVNFRKMFVSWDTVPLFCNFELRNTSHTQLTSQTLDGVSLVNTFLWIIKHCLAQILISYSLVPVDGFKKWLLVTSFLQSEVTCFP